MSSQIAAHYSLPAIPYYITRNISDGPLETRAINIYMYSHSENMGHSCKAGPRVCPDITENVVLRILAHDTTSPPFEQCPTLFSSVLPISKRAFNNPDEEEDESLISDDRPFNPLVHRKIARKDLEELGLPHTSRNLSRDDWRLLSLQDTYARSASLNSYDVGRGI